MQSFRAIPRVEAAPELFEGGHLWLQEKVDGGPFRFELLDSGRLRVGDDERVYEPEAAPPEYQHAVRHVREECEWGALRSAVDDVESVVFFGQAMHRRRIEYDWDDTPSFLGFDIWSGAKDAFLGVDSVEHVFERLGLRSVNTFAKEVRAVDFDPDSYEVPPSNWYDGPAAGVVIRNKRGAVAQMEHPTLGTQDGPVVETLSGTELARELVTARRVRRAVVGLERRDTAATFDSVYERVIEQAFRETHPTRFTADTVEMRAFRSEAAAQIQELME